MNSASGVVRDDAAAGLHVCLGPREYIVRSTMRVEVSRIIEVHHRAGVSPRRVGSSSSMISIARTFGAHGRAQERGGERVETIKPSRSVAFNDEVKYA